MERLEDRALLSNTYSLSNGNLVDNGVTVASNVIQYSIGRSGYAYYITPSSTSVTVDSLYINAGPSSGDNFFVASVYKYGVVTNNVHVPYAPNQFDEDAYYWNAVDGKLWVNTASSFIQISTDPIKDFALRGNISEIMEDGYAFWWDSDGALMANTPTYGNPTLTVEVDAGIKGFGLRNDGSIYYWDAASNAVYLNPYGSNVSSRATITTDALGFGMRSDGNGYYWDATQGSDLFLNTPNATYNLSSGPVQSFSAAGYCIDANAFNSSINGSNYYIGGTGYFVTSNSTNFYYDTPSVGAGWLLGNLSSPTINSLWRVSNSDPGIGATVWVQTTTGNGSYVYEPFYGSPTVNLGSGPELTSSTVKEYLIYWGTEWPSPSSGPNESTLNSAVSTLLSSNYLKSLSQYVSGITGNATLAGEWTDTSDTLGSTFSASQIETVVINAINANRWPTTTSVPNAAIYMVITQPGSSFSGSNEVNGFHGEFTDGSGNQDVFGWAEDSGSTAGILAPLSHETVESISDPVLVPNSNGSVNAQYSGITENAAPAITTLLGALGFVGTTDELADYEPNLLNYVVTFAKNGVTTYAQAYWSNSLQAYIVET